jgi:hypothetical protein
LEVATMNKPKLELVDQTFDVAFETMRDHDMARVESCKGCPACGGQCNQLLSEDEVEAFLAGLENVFDDATVLSDEDLTAVG